MIEDISIKVSNFSENPLPIYKTMGSSCCDVYSNEDRLIESGKTVTIGTGLFTEIPEGWRIRVIPRSGLACDGLTVLNAPGEIDSDYRGEIKIILHNTAKLASVVSKGDRIAQFSVEPVFKIKWLPASELSDSDRGDGGFGSTGK